MVDPRLTLAAWMDETFGTGVHGGAFSGAIRTGSIDGVAAGFGSGVQYGNALRWMLVS